MTTPFTPDKTAGATSFRAIEQWQLTHEGIRFVTGDILQSAGARGAIVYNTTDGLHYYFNGDGWKAFPGQALRDNFNTPFYYQLTSDSPQSADAEHDVLLGAFTLVIPDLSGTQNRILLEASCSSFVYAVDPGVDAIFTLKITDSANVELAGGESVFQTGSPGGKASGIYIRRLYTNADLPAGNFDLKLRVASTVTTQAYGVTGTADRPSTLSARIL